MLKRDVNYDKRCEESRKLERWYKWMIKARHQKHAQNIFSKGMKFEER